MQVALEVKLTRELFVAVRSRSGGGVGAGGGGGGANGRAVHDEHAVLRPVEMLTRIAEALGYAVSDDGTLFRAHQVSLSMLPFWLVSFHSVCCNAYFSCLVRLALYCSGCCNFH